MNEAIFLSASVPDPNRSAEFAATANSVAITAAVSALVNVTLGRRLLVWGGHPAITPMISYVANHMGIDYGNWVRLYQSRYFEDQFSDENTQFQNVTYTECVKQSREKSLRLMRQRMFSEHNFKAAIFIGGMDGIVDEFEQFQELQPNASIVPVVSTGGATIKVAEKLKALDSDLQNDLDYIALFYRYLNIDVTEPRALRRRNSI